jgi:hypothetical protein
MQLDLQVHFRWRGVTGVRASNLVPETFSGLSDVTVFVTIPG